MSIPSSSFYIVTFQGVLATLDINTINVPVNPGDQFINVICIAGPHLGKDLSNYFNPFSPNGTIQQFGVGTDFSADTFIALVQRRGT